MNHGSVKNTLHASRALTLLGYTLWSFASSLRTCLLQKQLPQLPCEIENKRASNLEATGEYRVQGV
eukprot:6180652-Pleurochrysis_carterae.AAC.2